MIAADIQIDLRQADRDLRDLGIDIRRAAYTALKRTGGNIRRQYLSAIRNNGSAITGKFRPYAKAWYRLLGGGRRKPGGMLTQNALWPIEGNRADSITVDILPRLRDHLARWQFGGGGRAAQLRRLVAWYRDTDKGRKVYHGKLVGLGYPPHVSQLPPVVDQPVRDVVGPIRAHAADHVVEWFVGNLKSLASGRSKLFGTSGSRSTYPAGRSSAARPSSRAASYGEGMARMRERGW